MESSASDTTNNVAMKITVGSPKPAKAWFRVSTPVAQRRKQLDSDVADISNLGGSFAGCTTAALFLQEFVGEKPWAHIDIAGTMSTDADDSWRSAGATGYGARLLAQLAADF